MSLLYFPVVVPAPSNSPVRAVGCIHFNETWADYWVNGREFGFSPFDVTVTTIECIRPPCGNFRNTKLEVSYFNWAFRYYKEFTVSLWYRRLRDDNNNGVQGLINMAVCQDGGPLRIVSPEPGKCEATVNTTEKSVTLSAEVQIFHIIFPLA